MLIDSNQSTTVSFFSASDMRDIHPLHTFAPHRLRIHASLGRISSHAPEIRRGYACRAFPAFLHRCEPAKSLSSASSCSS